MKVSDLQSLPPKVLIYGPAGRGKTSLMLTLGEGSMILDLDGNLDIAFGLKDNLHSARMAVEVKQFLDEDPINSPSAFLKCKKYVQGLAAEIKAGKFPFDVLSVDGLSTLAVAAQMMVMKNSSKAGQNPEIQHWGLLLTEIENVAMTLRSLPIPMFMAAHQMDTVDSDQNTMVQIAVPGQKLPGKITRLFTEIWYLRIRAVGEGKQEIYIQTTPTQTITCRSGRGLPTGTVIGTIDKTGSPGTSVSLRDLLNKIHPQTPTKGVTVT